ncbi:MAG: heat shock protein HtpX [Candidatus Tokpelaia sp. JSC161]|jgi:heat shock protein HtpX|nr:MAG: heat shock protein HtpX [Candidatus Tokpelaia sp. JSC161]
MNAIRTAMLMAFMSALCMVIGYLIGGWSGTLLAFFTSTAINFFYYWYSDTIVLHIYGAKESNSESFPEYHQIVTNLANQANIQKPRLYIIQNKQPNAFATGRNPQK